MLDVTRGKKNPDFSGSKAGAAGNGRKRSRWFETDRGKERLLGNGSRYGEWKRWRAAAASFKHDPRDASVSEGGHYTTFFSSLTIAIRLDRKYTHAQKGKTNMRLLAGERVFSFRQLITC